MGAYQSEHPHSAVSSNNPDPLDIVRHDKDLAQLFGGAGSAGLGQGCGAGLAGAHTFFSPTFFPSCPTPTEVSGKTGDPLQRLVVMARIGL